MRQERSPSVALQCQPNLYTTVLVHLRCSPCTTTSTSALMAPSGGIPVRFLNWPDKSDPPCGPPASPWEAPDPAAAPFFCFCAWQAAASAQLATAETRGSASCKANADSSCSSKIQVRSETGKTHTCDTPSDCLAEAVNPFQSRHLWGLGHKPEQSYIVWCLLQACPGVPYLMSFCHSSPH